MNVSAKKIFAGLLAGAIIFAGTENIFAERYNPRMNQNQDVKIETVAKEFSDHYGVNEKEVLDAIKDGVDFFNIRQAAILSKASGKSFKQVLSMYSDWSDVAKKLNISDEKFNSIRQDMLVERISAQSDLDSATVEKLLKDNYHPHDISIAGILAKNSNKNIQDILDMKKINKSWFDVAEELGVDKDLISPRQQFWRDDNKNFNPMFGHQRMGHGRMNGWDD